MKATPRRERHSRGMRPVASILLISMAVLLPDIVFAIPPLQWPLCGNFEDRTISLHFGNNWPFAECPEGTDKVHVGVDVNAISCEAVRAAEAGVVRAVVTQSPWASCVTIEHSGYTTVCWHVNSLVIENQAVIKGQLIGTVADLDGNTHFHFGAREAVYSNISNAGALPTTDCSGYPAFPEDFLDPQALAFEEGPLVGYFADGWHNDGTSQAFLEAFTWFRHDGCGLYSLGDPFDNGGSKFVHLLNGIWVQDFFGPDNGLDHPYTALMRGPGGSDNVQLLKEGFWDYWMNNAGWVQYGHPQSDEYTDPATGYPRQDFYLGFYFLWPDDATYPELRRTADDSLVLQSLVSFSFNPDPGKSNFPGGIYHSGAKAADFGQPIMLQQSQPYGGFYYVEGGEQFFIDEFTVAGDSTIVVGNCVGDGAYSLNGINQFLSFTPYNPGSSDFTIEGWLNLNSYATGGLANTLFHQEQNGATGRPRVAVTIETSGYLHFNVGGPDQDIYSNSIIPLDAWTYFACMREGGIYRIYIDGELDSTVTYGSNVPVPTITSPAYIGHRYNTSYPGAQYYFDGLIDEIRLSSKARSASEILAAYSSRTELASDADTEILWHLNGAAGTPEKITNCQGNSAFDLVEHNAPQAVAGFNECNDDAEIQSYVIDLTVLPQFPTAGETFQVWVLLEGFENEFLNDFRVAALNGDGTLAQIIHGPIPVDMSNGYDGVYTCALSVPGTYSIAVQYSLDGGTQWSNFNTDAETANPLPISILECIGNGAYSLNGTNQCLRVPDQPVLDLNSDWTIEFWHRPGSIPAADELRTMVAKNNHSLNKQQYLIGWRNDASGVGYTGIYVLISENGAESGTRTHLWPYAFQPGNLYYIAVVYRIAQGEVEVFVNGASQGAVLGYLTNIYASDTDFKIGSESGVNYYHGMIDEVRVSNIAREASGFVEHYATRSAYAPDANTIGLWHMNGAAGTNEKKDNAQGDYLLDLFEMNSPVATCGFDGDGMSTVGESIKSVSILKYAYPNPFNPMTTISFDLPKPTAVSLRIYDVSGRLVRTLLGGEVVAEGRRDATWDGRDHTGKQVAAGVYFYRLEAGEFRETKRMVLVR